MNETADPADADISKEIPAARQLLRQGNLDGAIARLESVLDRDPGHQEALYVLAVCHRYDNDLQSALAILQKLLGLFPDNARAHQEHGHVYRKMAQAKDAARAYERAVALNPALLASWQNLAKLYRELGDTERNRTCEKRSEGLQSLPPELRSVTSMIYEGKLYQAEQLCRVFLQKNRQHVVGMRLLAKIATDLGILDDADFLLESCLEFAPDFQAARFDYTQVLYKRQRFEKSMEQAGLLLAIKPASRKFRLAYANAAVPMGQFGKAIDYYGQLSDENPDDFRYPMFKGHALKSLGERQAAIDAYHEAAKIKPDHGDAWWSLANVKTYRFEIAEITQMQSAEADTATELVDRYQLCFALGKSFEDSAKFGSAFEYYERGNRLKKKQCGYSADKTAQEFSRQRETCTEKFFTDRAGYGVEDSDPIFIVGLPRSGSTLLEQILASHPLIDGTIELPDILSLSKKLAGRHNIHDESRYPKILSTLDEKLFENFGKEYLKSTRVYRKGGRYFTDKMPNNFRHIGLIHLLFPNSKVIDARRRPMACCFSNFKQLFGDGQEFSYGLEEVGRYYRGYVELMDHWDNVLPGKILRVQYEDVVEDLETQVDRMLGFLGLPFDEHCIEFHKTERAVHTPSAEQVRQPLYKSGVEQWKNFEPFLEPLKTSLGLG